MSTPLYLQPLLAGLSLAIMAGPVGCFVSWRRMAFYGDALAHAALLGIALGLLVGIGAEWGVAGFIAVASTALLFLQRARYLPQDSLLAILAQGCLAGGIVLLYQSPSLQVNLYAYLFGDILSTSANDVVTAVVAGAIVLVLITAYWRPLLLLTLHEELAQAEGVRIQRMQALLMALIAVCVAVGVHVAGVLLMSALLVIPSATARGIARSPGQMAGLAMLFGLIGVGGGLLSSFRYDLPTGPAIVLCLSAEFLLFLPLAMRRF